jgi:hypothetical protein
MKLPRSVIPLILITMTLAACAAPIRWQHPTVPRDRWSADFSACRADAERLISRELARGGDPFDRRGYEIERNMRLFDARKRRDSFFSNCMREKGYRPIAGEQRSA